MTMRPLDLRPGQILEIAGGTLCKRGKQYMDHARKDFFIQEEIE